MKYLGNRVGIITIFQGFKKIKRYFNVCAIIYLGNTKQPNINIIKKAVVGSVVNISIATIIVEE